LIVVKKKIKLIQYRRITINGRSDFMGQKLYKSFYEFEKDMFPNKHKKRMEESKSKSRDIFSSLFPKK